MHVRPEAAVEFQKALHQKRCQQKGHRQSQGIYRKQEYALHQRILFSGNSKDRGQDGAQAGSPAEGKSEADHEGADRSAAAFHTVEAGIGVESLDLENASEMQPEENNDNSGDA